MNDFWQNYMKKSTIFRCNFQIHEKNAISIYSTFTNLNKRNSGLEEKVSIYIDEDK